MTTIQPINDNIVVEIPDLSNVKERKTDSGIFLGTVTPGTEKPNQGVVIAVGQGRVTSTGEIIPLNVKEGDNIIFNKFAGTELTVNSKKYLIIKETDILVIVK
jgi:chaperonin GroES